MAPAACLPQPDAELHNNNDPNHPAPKIQWPDANSIYPWTTEIGLSAPLPSDATYVYLCSPEVSKKQLRLDVRTCTDPLHGTSGGAAGARQRYTVDPNRDLGITRDGDIEPNTNPNKFRLLEGATGRICYTYGSKSDPEEFHSCATIKVQEPLFKKVWRVPAGTNFLVMGVLAPDTLGGLSSIDTSWYEDKNANRVARQIAVNDPSSAIEQALHAFDLLHKDEKNTEVGVLLTQMPPSEAKALADSLGESKSATSGKAVATRIDLIFSAADAAESSPKLAVEIDDPSKIRQNPLDPYFIPVFTPSPVFQQKDCLASGNGATACLSKVALGPALPPMSAIPSVQLTNTPPNAAHWNNPQNPVKAWKTPFCADQKAPTPTQAWECDVLQRMLEDTDADPKLGNSSDIAILEEKDFDFARISWSQGSPTQPDKY